MSVWGLIFFFKQKTAYEMRISDWSSDVCSSDLARDIACREDAGRARFEEGVDQHAAVCGEPGGLGKCDIGADADPGDDEIGSQVGAGRERHAIGVNRGERGFEMEDRKSTRLNSSH